MKLTIATSQFPVSSDILSNKHYILEQMQTACNQGAQVIQFPEGAISGYAGVDFESFEGFEWELMKTSVQEIVELAKKLKIWVLLGAAHRLTPPNKPHNCLYIINEKGEIEDRYDKMFCAGDDTGETEELKHFTPGNHFTTFLINGVLCGTLICHEYRYPELYREYKKRGVSVMFHSFHAGNMTPERQAAMEEEVGIDNIPFNPGTTLPEITMPATMISYAANNYLWISCSNTSATASCWAAFVARPDGVIIGRLVKNTTDLLITEIDTSISYYDSTKYWRSRAMNGVFHSGDLVKDVRSDDRKGL